MALSVATSMDIPVTCHLDGFVTTPFCVKTYDTRMDRFRARENISIRQWAEAAGVARTQFNKYRSGKMTPGVLIFAALVRSASRIVARPVRASELYDLGEDEPVAPAPRECGRLQHSFVAKHYNTRLDRLIRRLGVRPAALAREGGISRQALRRLRMRSGVSVVSTVRVIVSALRRMGHPVKASNIVDTGENPQQLLRHESVPS